jgi:hypothetical protein
VIDESNQKKERKKSFIYKRTQTKMNELFKVETANVFWKESRQWATTEQNDTTP